MKVIGIAGQCGMGKDVLADYLMEKLNKRILEKNEWLGECSVTTNLAVWHRSAFANSVKDIFCESFGVDRQFVEDWKRNPEPPPGFLKNVRQSLQFIGDGFRQIQGDIWIDIALRKKHKNLVISDSRYINEAKAVKKNGGIMIVLYRPGFMNNDPNPSEAQIKPIVEWCAMSQAEGPIKVDPERHEVGAVPKGIEHFDLFIRNSGTIEELHKKIDNIVVPYVLNKFKDFPRCDTLKNLKI